MTNTANQLTDKIKDLAKAGSLRIAVKHIEEDRAYRDIRQVDVRAVLKNGKVDSYSKDTIQWKGKDDQGREIILLCCLIDKDSNATITVTDAILAKVETAYHGGKLKGKAADDKLRKEWLKTRTDWKENSQGHVVKKNGKSK